MTSFSGTACHGGVLDVHYEAQVDPGGGVDALALTAVVLTRGGRPGPEIPLPLLAGTDLHADLLTTAMGHAGEHGPTWARRHARALAHDWEEQALRDRRTG